MRAVFGLVLLVGIALAGFAVYMVQDYFEQQQVALARERAAAAKAVETVKVYAMTREVAYGEELSEEDVAQIDYVKKFLPEGVFPADEPFFSEEADEPRTVIRPMYPNEPITTAKVTAPGEDAGLTSQLTAGKRAYAIRVDVASGVSGFLRPGDRVDIYWSGRTNNGEVTKLIESRVKLVAIDQTADSTMAGAMIARTVTVEATPQQVAGLAQAQSTGTLSLALVGAQDETVAESIEVDQKALLGIQERAEVEAPEPETCSIRTRRGSEVVDIPIPCTD